jgi:hypothetical protein
LTAEGKLFCILYAAFGIPFTLVFLSASVQRLLTPTFKFLAMLLSSKMGQAMSPLGIRVIHLLIMCTIFGLGFVILPMVVFNYVEPSWGYLDAFYFVFISLTTIGLGDYIPGDADNQTLRELYKAFVAGTENTKFTPPLWFRP